MIIIRITVDFYILTVASIAETKVCILTLKLHSYSSIDYLKFDLFIIFLIKTKN